jgi:hypothetical protein
MSMERSGKQEMGSEKNQLVLALELRKESG